MGASGKTFPSASHPEMRLDKGAFPMAKTNIVFILADDMGYGDVGRFGNDAVETTALDSIASNGLQLMQHYAGSPVCAPSRAALMTGRYPHRTGAIDTFEGRGLDRLALRETTIADLLKAGGYATGIMGKWHLGALDPRYHPNRRGFDEFVGFRGGWSDYYRWRLDCNATFRKADGRYLTDVFTDEAVQFIERHRDEPFFLHVTYNAPHFPFQVVEEDAEPFRESGQLDEGVCLIYAMNRRLDGGVGRIMETLRLHGLEQNTLVIFTSDNGPQLGTTKDGLNLRRFNGGFAGSKGFVYEGGIRVPAVLQWPAGLPGDARACSDLIHFTDWLPTLLAVAGIDQPENLRFDGMNVLPVLRGESRQTNERRFWQWNRYVPVASSNASMRDGPWKIIRPRIAETMKLDPHEAEFDARLKNDPDSVSDIRRDPFPERHIPDPPPPLLFNVEEDPFEQNDLADQKPHIVSRMQRELDNWFEEVEAERRTIHD